MGKTFLRISACVLIAWAVLDVGCEYFPESTFQLAKESRLPKWITVPRGLTRADVSLEMSYYSKPWGSSAGFILRDKNKKILTKAYGKAKDLEPLHEGFDGHYPAYEVITVHGMTEIIEHRKMEPIFYVTDDPSVWKELMGAQPLTHP